MVPSVSFGSTEKSTHYTLSAFHSIATVERTFGSFRSKRPRSRFIRSPPGLRAKASGGTSRPNRLGGFQIDDELEFALLLHPAIGWPFCPNLPS